MLLDVAQQQVENFPSFSFSSLCPESARHFNCAWICCSCSASQEAGELIIGLPVSADGRETPQSNKVRSVVGRLAVQAADRCVRGPLGSSYRMGSALAIKEGKGLLQCSSLQSGSSVFQYLESSQCVCLNSAGA